MTEKIPESEPSEKPRIFTLGGLTDSGLPGDLWNAPFTIDAVLNLYEDGIYSEEQLRDKLRNAQTFEEYLRSQVKKGNEAVPEYQYDENTSLDSELKRIDHDLIKEFDKKILELRNFADKKIDIKEIKKVIWQEIKPLVYGKSEK